MVILDKSLKWKEIEYWKSICPDLTVTDKDVLEKELSDPNSNQKHLIDEHITKRLHCDLKSNGYGLVNFLDVMEQNLDYGSRVKSSSSLISLLATSIDQLTQNNLPASMILLYDEIWYLSYLVGKLISQSTHTQNQVNFDMLAWHIDPQKNESGFSPHRDRQPDNIRDSFHKDNGQAKYVTLWLALTDATPENSCLYMIPQSYDPGYYNGDDEGDIDDEKHPSQDPLQRALPDKASYQNIRAMPRSSGQAVMFTHRILHWGSKGNPSCTTPRIALSFVSSDATFEKPYLLPPYSQIGKCNESTKKETPSVILPPFHLRLLLVCAQLLIYYQRLNLDGTTIRSCYDYCKKYEHLLEEKYRKKVFVEFVKAMKEVRLNNLDTGNLFSTTQKDSNTIKISCKENDDNKNKSEINIGDGNDDDDDDDDEEAMLEAMLDAEAAGGADFEDDYDEEFDDDFGTDNNRQVCDDESDDDLDQPLFGISTVENHGRELGSEKKRIRFS